MEKYGSCLTCFYRRENECHKSPPVRLPRRFAEGSSAGNRVRDEELLFGWPKVMKDDWCGEYRYMDGVYGIGDM